MIIQLTGLSGSGKSTLAEKVSAMLRTENIYVNIVDGDVYRKTLCSDLGFSKEDRLENIRRLGKMAHSLEGSYKVVIIAAISPFEIARQEIREQYQAKTIWLNCSLSSLAERDTKGLYKRALLPDVHPEKIVNLTGVNDPYETPKTPDLVIDTGEETATASAQRLYEFIKQALR